MSLLKTLVLRSRQNLIKTTALRTLCTEKLPDGATEEAKLGGYAKAYEKFDTLQEERQDETPQTFAALLRNSKFIDLGDPEGKIVNGRIIYTIKDDLYIDFGWKFHCVCPRPKKNAELFVRGTKVRLLIKDLELSSRFLGFDKDLTLLEADCALLGMSQERTTAS